MWTYQRGVTRRQEEWGNAQRLDREEDEFDELGELEERKETAETKRRGRRIVSGAAKGSDLRKRHGRLTGTT